MTIILQYAALVGNSVTNKLINALICSVCQFLCYKYFLHGHFHATSRVTTGLQNFGIFNNWCSWAISTSSSIYFNLLDTGEDIFIA